MTLFDLLAAYCASRVVGKRYRESLLRSVKRASEYGITSVCQLTPDSLARLLDSLPVTPCTRSNIRRELLTLWRWAYDERMTDAIPRARRLSVPRQPPRAWSVDQLSAILSLAESDERPISRRTSIRRCDVLPAWIAIGYESGLRLTDILSLRDTHLQNGCVILTAHKTGKVCCRRLSAYALDKCNYLLSRSHNGSVFGWCLPRRRAILLWKDFLQQHGLSGSSKWLRRSGATQVERQQPGAAATWLDHSNPALCKIHYLDPTLLPVPLSPMPLR